MRRGPRHGSVVRLKEEDEKDWVEAVEAGAGGGWLCFSRKEQGEEEWQTTGRVV